MASDRATRLTSRISSVRPLSGSVLHVTLDVGSEYEWHPGQYLSVSPTSSGEKVKYYSIASAKDPRRPGALELVVGPSSDPLFLDVGVELFISPASGRRAIPEQHEGSAVLVGMGTGIAPLRAVLQERLLRAVPSTLLCGSRTPDDLLFGDEFRALTAGYFRYEPVLSQAAAEWSGRRGRVQDHLVSVLDHRAFFAVCGSKAMVSDVSGQLASLGVDPTRVFAEGY